MNIYKAGKFAKDWKKSLKIGENKKKIEKIGKIGKIWEEVGKKSTSRAFASRANKQQLYIF